MSSFAILTDVTKCIGCEDCVLACKQANDLPLRDAPQPWQGRAEDLSSTRWTTLAHTDVDAKEGFILSRINGQWDVQSILKVCPHGEDEVLLAFSRLVGRGIIALS